MQETPVVHITAVHPALDTRIFVKECATLAAAGYKVSLLVLGGKSERRNGVEIIGIPFKGSRWSRLVKGRKLLLQAARDLEGAVYHVHDPELLPLGLRLQREGHIVIYDAHEDLPRQIAHKHYIPAFLKGFAAWSIERVENFYASRLSAIVTVTPHIVARFQRIHSVVVEVCNYPDLKDIQMTKTAWSGNKVCYIGGITEARGIRELLDALTHADVQLILAGEVSPIQLLSELQQHPAWSKVDYRGFQDRAGVNEIMRESVAGLVTLRPHPGYMTAYPVKMFEYMAAGLPVIATLIPLWKGILERHEAGTCIDISNAPAYRRTLEQVTSDEKRAECMGMNGHRAVLSDYNWQKESKKLIELYTKLLSH
jgi:glycosyltransferase involved in cell wall biosynthesis